MGIDSPFFKAAGYFAKAAAVVILLLNATALAGYWITVAGEIAAHGRVPDHFAKMLRLLVLAPLATSWVAGGIFGRRLYHRPPAGQWKGFLCGAGVGFCAAAAMWLIAEWDISNHDYSQTIETSAARSRSATRASFAVVLPIAAIVSGLLGRRLAQRIGHLEGSRPIKDRQKDEKPSAR